jgi:hypothetical protein
VGAGEPGVSVDGVWVVAGGSDAGAGAEVGVGGGLGGYGAGF